MRLYLLLLLLVACTPEYNPNLGAVCSIDSDCDLPMDYAIQSNCPFGTACIDSTCRVVCPLIYHDLNPEVSKSYQFECKEDTDCDCSQRDSRTLECICHSGACLSVEA